MKTKIVGFLKISLLLIVSFFLSHFSFGQSKWDKLLEKGDTEYESGNYTKAVKQLNKTRKKATKKLGAKNKYTPSFYIREAKYNLAAGLLNNFSSILDEATETSKSVNGDTSIAHVKNLLQAAEAYTFYGNFLHAKNYLNEASKILTLLNEPDGETQAATQLIDVKILSGQGFYAKALSRIKEIAPYIQGRAVTKESFVDKASGKLKTKRVSEADAKIRFAQYASLLTVKSNTFRLQGNFLSADSAFAATSRWIDKNLGKSSKEFVENQFLFAQMLEENGVQNLPAKMYEKSLTYLKRKHEPSHYIGFDIYESLLKNYLKNDEKGKYKNLRGEYAKSIKKYFKKNSLHHVNLNTIEFNDKLDKEKTANLQGKAGAIISSTSTIPENHKKRIEILQFLYNVALTERDYINAEKYLNNIISIKAGLYGDDSPQYHLSLVQAANFFVDFSNKIEAAEEIYTTSFDNIVAKEISPGHIDYVNILNHRAELYESNDEYDKASKALDEALRATRVKYDNKDIDYGKELNKIAGLQLKIGEYEKAKNNIDEALSILETKRRDKNELIHYVETLETKARYLAINGLYDDAESAINKSQKLYSKAASKAEYDQLSAKEELAGLYILLGKYAKTEVLLSKLVQDYSKQYGPRSRKLIPPLIDIGKLMLIIGDYTEAEKNARRANNIAVKIFGNTSTKAAKSHILLSEIYNAIGDYQKAEQEITKAIHIEEKSFGTDHIDLAKSNSQLALITFYEGKDLDKANLLMKKSLSIIAKKLGTGNPAYAEALKRLAVISIAQKNYSEAFNSLDKAKTIWESKVGRRNNINTANIYTLTGEVYYQQRNYLKATENFEEAKRLYEKFFSDQHPEYVKVLSKLAKVAYMQNDLKKSRKYIDESLSNHSRFIKEYFPSLSEREKAKFWNTIKPDFEFYNTLALRLKEQSKDMVEQMFNNALISKSLLLNSSIKIRQRILSSNDESLKDQYKKWMVKKELLTTALSMGADQLAENEIDPVVLSDEIELLEKELSQKSELFSQSFESKNVTWENVKNALGPNEVAIEMLRFRYFNHSFTDSVVYAALYVKHKNEQQKPDIALMLNGKELEDRFFKYYRNSIIFKVEDKYSYEKYWKPLQNVVGAYATVYLSADGVYNQINLETIPTGNGKYVLDNSNLVLVSNTKDIYFNKVKTQTVQKEKKASIFGNPDFYLSASSSGKINALPGTEREVSELKKLLADKGWVADDYMDSQASEGQVKKMDNPKVFHVATHGFFTKKEEKGASGDNSLEVNENKSFENPLLRTGLLLTGAGDLLDKSSYNYNTQNGILTAYEAMNLNLDKTELVVLSACETGLGDLEVGEGVYGLQRAFMVAGAKTLIMSMFKVDDEATQQLMVKFYKKWLETGDKRESFITAKKEIRNNYKDPIYWGAFIMIGLD